MIEARFKDQIGDEYDLFQLASPHYSQLEQSIGILLKNEFAKLDRDNIKILEIGFGTGITSKIILKADKRILLSATDNEQIMLGKAIQSLSDFNPDRFHLEIKDALQYTKSFSDNSFDAVVSAFVIHNFLKDYRFSVIKEIYRILKPDGFFINADKIAVINSQQHIKNLNWQIEQFNIFEKLGKPELKKEWTEHYLEDEKPDRVLIEDDFENTIKSIGFHSFNIFERWYDDAVALIKK
jgi:tRNA (cmo5U34)-methyltransferase